jgi:RNA polymerase sigma-70 factor (ECF subfamily)
LALGLAVRLVNDRVRAEDLVHEAFVTVWREIHEYQGTDLALPHWLLGLVQAAAAQSNPDGVRHVSGARRAAPPNGPVDTLDRYTDTG